MRVHIPFEEGFVLRASCIAGKGKLEKHIYIYREATVLYSLPLKQAMRSDFLF
jgi:hypothetical protein